MPITIYTISCKIWKSFKCGSTAPKGSCYVWIEKLNNKLLGIDKGTRAKLTPKQKGLLNTLCQIERAAVNEVLETGGNDKEAYHAAKQQAQEFMRLFGQPLLAA